MYYKFHNHSLEDFLGYDKILSYLSSFVNMLFILTFKFSLVQI